jgi:hypothetical protein
MIRISIYLTLTLTALTCCWPHGNARAQVFEEQSSEAQSDQKEKEKDKDDYRFLDHFIYGGNVGARFGVITYINLNPMVGYRVNDRLVMGTRGIYTYYRDQRLPQYGFNVLGGSGFGQYFFTENLYGQGEYQVLNGYFDNSGHRTNLPFLYVGGGYLYRITDAVGINISALYEVLRFRYYPSLLPIIQVGVAVGM